MPRSENVPSSPDINDPVDMIAYAREMTRRDVQRVAPSSIKLIAPAKVNLFLGVGERREDGYHEVDNVLHALALHDVLYMSCGDDGDGSDDAFGGREGCDCDGGYGGGISVQMIGYGGVEVPDVEPSANIAYRAVQALAQAIGRTQREHMSIRIEKHIPHQAGLGGGSSDAAAALVGAAHLWGLGSDAAPVIERVAQSLGADVAFFLRGACAYYSARGDVFERALAPRKDSIVLIKPEGGLSTARVYAEFDAGHEPVAAGERKALLAAAAAEDVPLLNNLAAPAERLMPELARVREWALVQPGARAAMLCGSGAATFVLCDSFNAACKLAAAAKLQGWWARTSSLCAAKAARSLT